MDLNLTLTLHTLIGPFTATSGMILPYYLNATTNLMDRLAAPKITGLLLDVLVEIVLGPGGFTPADPLLIVGMEMAGGAMVAQAAALAGVRYPEKVRVRVR